MNPDFWENFLRDLAEKACLDFRIVDESPDHQYLMVKFDRCVLPLHKYNISHPWIHPGKIDRDLALHILNVFITEQKRVIEEETVDD